jgi:hypothetical protein
MTRTWVAVLTAALGLHGALLQAAPPDFKDLPPSEIKVAPLPLDTKAPPAPPPEVGAVPAPSAPGPAPAACAPACKPVPCGEHCKPKILLDLHLGSRDHPHAGKLWAWVTYRPCQRTSPSCCGFLLPVPSGYEFFLTPGCAEGSGGSCCNKSSCGAGCNGCGK